MAAQKLSRNLKYYSLLILVSAFSFLTDFLKIFSLSPILGAVFRQKLLLKILMITIPAGIVFAISGSLHVALLYFAIVSLPGLILSFFIEKEQNPKTLYALGLGYYFLLTSFLFLKAEWYDHMNLYKQIELFSMHVVDFLERANVPVMLQVPAESYKLFQETVIRILPAMIVFFTLMSFELNMYLSKVLMPVFGVKPGKKAAAEIRYSFVMVWAFVFAFTAYIFSFYTHEAVFKTVSYNFFCIRLSVFDGARDFSGCFNFQLSAGNAFY